jgi:hypothetical protein
MAGGHISGGAEYEHRVGDVAMYLLSLEWHMVRRPSEKAAKSGEHMDGSE